MQITEITMKKEYLWIGGGLLGAVVIAWYLLTPHSYEDCILMNLKSNASDEVVAQIELACTLKYSSSSNESSCKERNLTPSEMVLVTGYGKIEYDYLNVTLHNGNPKTKVTKVQLSLQGDNMNPAQIYNATIKTFSTIDPFNSVDVFAKLPFSPKNPKWAIASLMTCER